MPSSRGEPDRVPRRRGEPARPADAPTPGDLFPGDDTATEPVDAVDVAALLRRTAAAESSPDAATSARMRSRLLAAIGAPEAGSGAAIPTPRRPQTRPQTEHLVERAGDPTTPRAAGRRRATTRHAPAADTGPGRRAARRGGSGVHARSGRRLPRPTIAAAAAVLVGVLAVTSFLLGRGALPGDAFYPVKRVVESARLTFTPDADAVATDHLEFAGRRLDEVGGLLDRARSRHAGADPDRVRTTLDAFRVQTQEGVRGTLARHSDGSAEPTARLRDWARTQSSRLDALGDRLPAAVAAPSQALLEQVGSRVDALDRQRDCAAAATGHDELGPLPTRCATPEPVRPPTPPPAAPPPTRSTTPSPSATTTTTPPRPAPGESAGAAGARPNPAGQAPAGPALPPGAPAGPPPLLPPTISVPLPVPAPLPRISVPPIVPGLPGIRIG